MAGRGAAAIAAACLPCVFLVYQILPGDAIWSDAARGIVAAAIGAIGAFAARVPMRGQGRTSWIGVAAVACSCAGTAASLAFSGMPAAPVADIRAVAAVALLACLPTALWEELVFRGILPHAFSAVSGKPGGIAPCVASAAIFAVLHAGGADGVAAVVRPIEAFLFGLAMWGVARSGAGLAGAVASHALYDAVCIVPAIPGAGLADLVRLPVGQLAQIALDPVFASVSAVCLVPLAAVALLSERAR